MTSPNTCFYSWAAVLFILTLYLAVLSNAWIIVCHNIYTNIFTNSALWYHETYRQKKKKIMQPLQICIGPTVRIGQESWCLLYAGFFYMCLFKSCRKKFKLKRNYKTYANKVSPFILCQLISHNYSIDVAVWKTTSQPKKYFEHLTIHDGSCQATDHIN